MCIDYDVAFVVSLDHPLQRALVDWRYGTHVVDVVAIEEVVHDYVIVPPRHHKKVLVSFRPPFAVLP